MNRALATRVFNAAMTLEEAELLFALIRDPVTEHFPERLQLSDAYEDRKDVLLKEFHGDERFREQVGLGQGHDAGAPATGSRCEALRAEPAPRDGVAPPLAPDAACEGPAGKSGVG